MVFLRKRRNSYSRHSFLMKGREWQKSKKKYIPVIVQHSLEDRLHFSRKKFLIPSSMSASHFSNLVRSKLQLPSYQSCSLHLSNSRLSSLTTMGSAFREHKDDSGALCLTVASENTFGCRAPIKRPVSPQFEPVDEFAVIDELPANLAPDVEVIHLTAVVGNPLTNVEQPASAALSESIPNFENHVHGIVGALGEAIMQALHSDHVHQQVLQSTPDTEITINPQLVKEALLDYMNEHSLSFTPPFDIDNFYTIVKIVPPPPPDEE